MGSALSICKAGRQKEAEEAAEAPSSSAQAPVDAAPDTASPPRASSVDAGPSAPPAASLPATPAPAVPPPIAETSPAGGATQLPRGLSEEKRGGRDGPYEGGSAGPHGLVEESHHDGGEDPEQQVRMQIAAEIDSLNMEVENLGQQIESLQARKEALMAPQEVQDSSEEALALRTEVAQLEAAVQSQVESNADLSRGCAEAEQQMTAMLAQADTRQGQGDGKLQALVEANHHLMALSQESEAVSGRNEELLRLFQHEHAEHEELEAQIASLEADILPLLNKPPPAVEPVARPACAEQPDLDSLRAASARISEENSDLAAQRHELELLLEGIAPVPGAPPQEDAVTRQEPETSKSTAELEAVKAELQRLRQENVELSKLRNMVVPQRLQSGQAFPPPSPMTVPQVTVHSSIETIPTRRAPQTAEPTRQPLCTSRVIQSAGQSSQQGLPSPLAPAAQLSPSALHWPQSPSANVVSQFGASPVMAPAPAFRLGSMPANAAAVPTVFVR